MRLVDCALVGSLAMGLLACGDDETGEAVGNSATAGTDSQGTDSATMTATGTNTVTETATVTEGTDSGTSNGSTSTTPGTTSSATGTGAATEAATGSTGETQGTGATEGSTSMNTEGSTSMDTGSTGEGSTGGQGVMDTDDDGIPDPDDPFPDDGELPGIATANLIYAHTSSTLYTMQVEEPYTITEIGGFTFPGGSGGSVTDLAIDRWGVLYVITFSDLHVCEPDTAACHYLADIPNSSNGLTFVPPGVLAADDDSLIGIANSGDWRHLELEGGMVNQMVLGSYGGGYTSAGDAFSIEGVGTYAAVNAPNVFDGNVIVEVDPSDGAVLLELGTLNGYSTVYGLAGWAGSIFAFNSGGEVLLVDPDTGMFELINDTPYAWWGAGVRTILPQ